ncbi:DUF2470 domain-containing protein [Solwaraspora sp. WMMD1047]|uniref:DUF2470 domain-containing protein n=1 Tax=Solwaraspora sp. WMMD1047 TaxID=3016102 RepID=UPI002416AF9C|nr:DUF2470 domain-containing protein [Solwaraspora sp. WMMD1047]MDG4832065.1 DUF2470 domain-containing protein [Solwaraspora sp. WMMD1047]
MQPSPAEVARTLATGHLAGRVQVAYRPGAHQVRHAVDRQGRVLLLVSIVDDLALALLPVTGADDAAVVLDVQDLPPAAGAPSLGRVWISGWAAPLTGPDARRAALDFADVDPTGDLLDVGTRLTIYRFDAAEVRLERAGAMIDIDPKEYAEAEPDPLHRIERDLLADLADHHAPEIADFIRRQLGASAERVPAGSPEPRVVRMDRYGLLVALGAYTAPRWARLAFPRPLCGHADLVRLLHPVICRRGREHPGHETHAEPIAHPNPAARGDRA